MPKSLTEMAAEIVAAQASHASLSADEMNAALRKTFEALQGIKAQEESAEAQAEEVVPSMQPQASIQRNKVICLECGKEFKQLTNKHLKEHGMDAREYRRKYGFPARQPLTAKSLTAKRRKTAKELRLGERLQKARESKAEKQAKKRTTTRRKKKSEAGSAETS
jgi:predicted transcriptional regulator